MPLFVTGPVDVLLTNDGGVRKELWIRFLLFSINLGWEPVHGSERIKPHFRLKVCSRGERVMSDEGPSLEVDVAAIGCSQRLGWGVQDNEAHPSIFADSLSANVLNVGASGYSSI